MTIVTMKEYYKNLQDFVNKHDVSKVETSPLENNTYRKTYLCEDGATGYEINSVVSQDVEVEVKGLKFVVTVKMLETEWFDTDNGKSIYLYQKA